MQYGGVKLINPKKYTDTNREEKIGFTPIFNMIKSEGSRLQILSYTSVKGFVYTLHVNPQNTEYNGLDDNFTRFDKPITSFVLKVVIISPYADTPLTPYMLPKDNSIIHTSKKDNNLKIKHTESEETFFQECKIQQDIWSESIQGGREPICPSVVNLAFFTNSQAKNILTGVFFPKLDSSNTHDSECQRTLKYLFDELELNKNFKLSIMTMPLEKKTFTLDTIQRKYNSRYINEALVQGIAQIIRLFIERSIIHFDLHSDNVLIYIHNNVAHCLLIDFERVCDLKNPILNKFIDHESDREYYSNIQDEKYNLFEKLIEKFDEEKELKHENDEEKIRFITEIITILASVDEFINTKLYRRDDKPIFQMKWINELHTNYYVRVFNVLHKMIKKNYPKLLPRKIKLLKEKNHIIDFYYANGIEKSPEWFYESNIASRVYRNEFDSYRRSFDIYFISNSVSRSNTKKGMELMKSCSRGHDDESLCIISGGKHKKSRKNKNPNENYTPKNKSRKISNKKYL